MTKVVEVELHAQGKARAEAIGAVVRGAEVWQFFAFVFVAVVTLGLALADEIHSFPWRVAVKVEVFFGFAYLTLLNVRIRKWLVRVLGAFKEERP